MRYIVTGGAGLTQTLQTPSFKTMMSSLSTTSPPAGGEAPATPGSPPGDVHRGERHRSPPARPAPCRPSPPCPGRRRASSPRTRQMCSSRRKIPACRLSRDRTTLITPLEARNTGKPERITCRKPSSPASFQRGLSIPVQHSSQK